MKKRVLTLLLLALLLIAALFVPAFALTESEVEAQVAASSKEAVTGNVLIWFLCAVAFLKVSQKVDSLLATMGVNAGRTGGSLMAETIIAVRAVSMIAKAGGHAVGSVGHQGSSNTASPDSTGGFFKGGLIGMAGRHITNSAVKTATAQNQSASAATYTASTAQSHDVHSDRSVQPGGPPSSGQVQSGGVNVRSPNVGSHAESYPASVMNSDNSGIIQTENSVQSDSSVISGQDSVSSETFSDSAVFSDSMAQQEGVIITGHESQSAVHTDHASAGPVTGPAGSDSAAVSSQVSQSARNAQTINTGSGGERVHTQAKAAESTHTQSKIHTARQTSIGGAVFAHSLASGGKFANDVIGTVTRGEVAGSITGGMAAQSLQSYLGYTTSGKVPPIFYNAEIGRGRITGSVSTPEHPEPIAFGMYHAAQYSEPQGEFSKIRSVDGTLWYTQLAQDTVEHKPYNATDGTVAYDEKIVKKLPAPPKRKDRI